MRKFSSHKWWVVTLGLSVPVIVLAATPIPFPSFSRDTPISSSQMTQNFQNIEKRLADLEGKAAPSISCLVKPSTPPDPHWIATCPAGYALTGGGCATKATLTSVVRTSRPMPQGSNQWTCAVTEVPDDQIYTYAICCKIN